MTLKPDRTVKRSLPWLKLILLHLALMVLASAIGLPLGLYIFLRLNGVIL